MDSLLLYFDCREGRQREEGKRENVSFQKEKGEKKGKEKNTAR